MPCLYLHLNLWITSERLLKRLNNELVINLVLSINYSFFSIFFFFSNSCNFFFYAMHSTFMFSCIMAMISNFAIFLSCTYLFPSFSLQIWKIFAYSYDYWCSFLINSFFFLFRINYVHCMLSHKAFSYNLYLFINQTYFLCF